MSRHRPNVRFGAAEISGFLNATKLSIVIGSFVPESAARGTTKLPSSLREFQNLVATDLSFLAANQTRDSFLSSICCQEAPLSTASQATCTTAKPPTSTVKNSCCAACAKDKKGNSK